MHRYVLALALVCAAAAPLRAQDEPEGAKDHPMFSRMPGYYINEYDAQDFASVELETEPPKKVEGRYWQIEYWVKEGAKKFGPVQIARNHIDPILKRGGRRLADDVDTKGGTVVAQLPVSGGKNVWVQINVTNFGDTYTLTVVEEAAMEQLVEFTATELADALNTKGAVTLHNILFDSGKATIKGESASALAPLGELLKNDSRLKLEIDGHTDNVGPAAANMKLSQDRAAAVKAYLVQNFGVNAARLTTAGFGDTNPVAPNTTEEGRAQNRRVEFVRQP
jgi:outer membrane protein OmpA-like peptidoglycan-associated protein